MMETRKEYLRQQFIETYDRQPEEVFDDYEPTERDLEVALRLDRDKFASIAVIIRAERFLEEVDKDHLSEESKEDIETTEAQLRFSKKVEMAKYGMPWSEIRQLFQLGKYDELEEAYSEEWDFEDLAKWETDISENGGDTSG